MGLKNYILIIFFCFVLDFKGQTQNKDSLVEYASTISKELRSDLLYKNALSLFAKNPKKAIEFGELAYKYAKSSKDKEQEANAIYVIGRSLLLLDRDQDAFDKLVQARQIYKTLKKVEGESMCLLYMGDIYTVNNDVTSALQKYTESFGLVTSDFVMHDYSEQLCRLGATCLKLGSLQKAEDYYSNGYESAKRYKNINNITNCINGIGEVDMHRGFIDSALSKFNEAFKYAKQMNFIPGAIKSLINMSEAYKKKNDPVNALKYLNEALQYSNRIKDNQNKSIIKSSQGGIYVSLNDLTNAAKVLEESKSLAQSLNNPELILENYKKNAEAARRVGNDSLAKIYEDLAMFIEDSIKQLDNHQRLKRIQSLYEKEKRIKQLELIKSEQEKSGSYMWVVLLLSIFISTLGVFAYYKYITVKKSYFLSKIRINELESLQEISKRVHNELSKKLYLNSKNKQAQSIILSFIDEDLENENVIFENINLFKILKQLSHEVAPFLNVEINNQIKPDSIVYSDVKVVNKIFKSYLIELSKSEKSSIEFKSSSYEPTIEISVKYFLSNDSNIDVYNDLRKVLVEKIGCKTILEKKENIYNSTIVLHLADRFDSEISE